MNGCDEYCANHGNGGNEMTDIYKAAQQALDAFQPLAAYGRIGSRDVEQAKAQKAIATLRAALAEPAEQEAVAAQHRFRHPEKGTPDWSVWQPCKINNKRPAHEIDSQGYQVQYRALYTAPQPVKREPSAGGVLFAVEQAIQNGDCPWQIEQAFDEYEAERKNGIGEQT